MRFHYLVRMVHERFNLLKRNLTPSHFLNGMLGNREVQTMHFLLVTRYSRLRRLPIPKRLLQRPTEFLRNPFDSDQDFVVRRRGRVTRVEGRGQLGRHKRRRVAGSGWKEAGGGYCCERNLEARATCLKSTSAQNQQSILISRTNNGYWFPVVAPVNTKI